MPDAPPEFDLAQLDAERPALLSPESWSSNLDALTATEPARAAEMRAIELPPHWRPAIALDGGVAYRIEPPGAAAAWLGASAAPVTRAAALLGAYRPGTGNPALCTIADGAVLTALLAGVPAQVAVFVFEDDRRRLAAALRLHDWSRALADGRCILLPGGGEAVALRGLLARRPALRPPGHLLLGQLVSVQRLAKIRRTCEDLG